MHGYSVLHPPIFSLLVSLVVVASHTSLAWHEMRLTMLYGDCVSASVVLRKMWLWLKRSMHLQGSRGTVYTARARICLAWLSYFGLFNLMRCPISQQSTHPRYFLSTSHFSHGGVKRPGSCHPSSLMRLAEINRFAEGAD